MRGQGLQGLTGSRREFLGRVARGAGACALGGVAWSWVVDEQVRAAPFALRPPGALPEQDFRAQCIKCGQCVMACPYDTLSLADAGSPYPIGTPYFEPRDVPCYMCPDLPCTRACPTGALDEGLTDVEASDMGLAVLVDQENCLSYRGLRCEICHRECPVSGEAITVEHHPRKLSKHAIFVPVVHGESCTGCGVCERVCPLPTPAIRVLPRELARAEPGEHYGFGWRTDEPMKGAEPAPADPGASLDYLNSGEP